MMSAGPDAFSAFISYAKADRESAEEICASLESRGFRCWIAPRDVRAGREYGNEIIRGIEQSRCLVLVLSEAANESHFVRREVERAVSKRKPVFPIRIEEVLPSPALELFVSTTHWIDAWSGNLSDHAQRLARDLGDESVVEEGSRISRKIARRRKMPKWVLAVVAFVAFVIAIVVANRISSKLAQPGPRESAQRQATAVMDEYLKGRGVNRQSIDKKGPTPQKRATASASKPSTVAEIQWIGWSGRIPLLDFRPLWRTIENVQGIRIGSEPDDLSRVIDIVGRDDAGQRIDLNFLRVAKPDNFNLIAIPWDRKKLYIQLTYKDGSTSEVHPITLENANLAPMVWLKAATASEGAMPPRVLATWLDGSLQLLPFAPNGTRKILAGFEGERLKPIEVSFTLGETGKPVPLEKVASWKKASDLRLLFQLQDGNEIGPFAYDLSPVKDMLRKSAAKKVRLDRRVILKCQRRAKDPLEPSVRCFADQEAREKSDWLGVKEIRLGPSPEDLSRTFTVNVPVEAFIAYRGGFGREAIYPQLQLPDGFVRLPGDTSAVYAKFVLYDGTELDPIRFDIESADH